MWKMVHSECNAVVRHPNTVRSQYQGSTESRHCLKPHESYCSRKYHFIFVIAIFNGTQKDLLSKTSFYVFSSRYSISLHSLTRVQSKTFEKRAVCHTSFVLTGSFIQHLSNCVHLSVLT